ncbi:hypothetical protein BLNAU_15188 [Blattamonas nauphoetae]|uniref:Uncharacterized protein n=1 Tax=Blattamonas nauphoetae TaxID=2049346 RepID=A0ABQ9XI79_9EUKA|nr:hypothetical protein BLNAU_15188 [Blattamonas nauphoetae]
MQKPTRRTFSLDVTAEPHPEVREAELNELLWTLGIAVWCSSSNTPHREREFSWKQWRDSHRPEKQRGCRRDTHIQRSRKSTCPHRTLHFTRTQRRNEPA